MLNSTHKPCISPFVAVTYAAVAVSGILMLFHIKLQGVHTIHQWAGILFLIGGATHIFLNSRVLLSYFKKTKAVYGTLAGVLTIVLLVSLFPFKGDGQRHGNGKGQITYGNNYRR
ncbi:MAG: hypothetical protein ACI8ZB_002512 [Desulforhopalus sp.]|jgi:hypothetical protein